MPDSTPSRSYLQVWDDTVTLRDLLLSLVITTTLCLGGYILAPERPPLPLMLGLGGALLGFMISAVAFRPKRRVDEEPSSGVNTKSPVDTDQEA
ncbi:hypothetical protein [Halomonas huangheensis]|uniref:Uncharacterized protein n=1 Tax=Halomonas huangheensis TaxID=1178482 RepID=W1NA08_9GAMM|nr:hypothetical protein [Halomonas huangheensis]ALM53740.1 hypothetical protein AR456_16755 [Halomonas huangheensis]ERL52344.1 hypothetical protein BJB45_10280 [Halomonas huangheensis]